MGVGEPRSGWRHATGKRNRPVPESERLRDQRRLPCGRLHGHLRLQLYREPGDESAGVPNQSQSRLKLILKRPVASLLLSTAFHKYDYVCFASLAGWTKMSAAWLGIEKRCWRFATCTSGAGRRRSSTRFRGAWSAGSTGPSSARTAPAKPRCSARWQVI